MCKKAVTKCYTLGGVQDLTVINASGLYGLILSSKLPSAKKFKRWVTSEVLPAVRKHGAYATEELLTNPDLAIAAFKALKEEREENKKLEQTVTKQTQQISEMAPKVGYYDAVLNCKDLVSMSVISKDYGWSGAEPAQAIREIKVNSNNNIFRSRLNLSDTKGYMSTKTHTYLDDSGHHTKVHTYWTQKGRLFIHDLLKEDGIYPQSEENSKVKYTGKPDCFANKGNPRLKKSGCKILTEMICLKQECPFYKAKEDFNAMEETGYDF